MKLINAMYGSDDRSLIRAIYQDDEGNTVAHMISSAANDEMYKEIMEKYTEYDLAKNYVDLQREEGSLRAILDSMNQSPMPNWQILSLVERLAASDVEKQEYDKVIEYLNKNEDEPLTVQYVEAPAIDYTYDQLMEIFAERENLFKVKLSLFEMDEVKNADRAIKSKLRKSSDIVELFALLHSLRQTTDSEQTESED